MNAISKIPFVVFFAAVLMVTPSWAQLSSKNTSPVVEGDLSELFRSRASKNIRLAKLLYARDVLQLFRPGIIKKFGQSNPANNIDMLFNHIRIAIRQAGKYKGYTAINIAGLVVGLASCMLILFEKILWR